MTTSPMPEFLQPRAIHLDGSLTHPAQNAWLRQAGAHFTDLSSFGPEVRYLCTRAGFQRLGEALRLREALHPAASRLTFYGSGDYHHLTLLLLRAFSQPFSLVVFDQHPDWDITSPWPCCGSWINEALRLPLVRRVVVIGLGAEDLHGWHLLRGNTRALREGRLELFPASQRIARDGFGYRRFRTVQAKGMDSILRDVIERLPTQQVYISIDKDCLTSQWAVSNWSPGELELPDITAAIAQLSAHCDVIGADVTGEWSPGTPCHPFFAAISRADHPMAPGFVPTQSQLQTNADTNRTLWQSFAAATRNGTKIPSIHHSSRESSLISVPASRRHLRDHAECA